jgi:hypothetical protein
MIMIEIAADIIDLKACAALADAAALKDRATRRLGEVMEAQRKTVGLAKSGRPTKIGLSKNPNITLAEIGVDKNLAHQARRDDSGIQKAPDRPHEGRYAARSGAGVTSLGGNQARMNKQYSGQSWRPPRLE